MDWWQPIVLGAGIAVLAGPLTELIRYGLTRKHEQDERRRSFQRDTLLALHEHLTNAKIAATLARVEMKRAGWSEHGHIDHISVFEQSATEARRYRVLIDDEQIRRIVRDALTTEFDALLADSESESDTKAGVAADLFAQADERIGEIVRRL